MRTGSGAAATPAGGWGGGDRHLPPLLPKLEGVSYTIISQAIPRHFEAGALLYAAKDSFRPQIFIVRYHRAESTALKFISFSRNELCPSVMEVIFNSNFHADSSCAVVNIFFKKIKRPQQRPALRRAQ